VLIGAYSSILFPNRRIAIPKKFLSQIGNKLILAKWYEECLILVDFNFWQALLERLTGATKVASLGVRDIERFILGSAFEIEADKQGRIIIPEILAEYARLKEEAIFLGLGNRIEIWPKEIWQTKSQELARETKEYIESLAKNEKR
jgi:MraZ protein